MDAIERHPEYEERIRQFFKELPVEDRDVSAARLSYVAVKLGVVWSLLRGRVDFNPLPRQIEPAYVDLDFVRAGVTTLGAAKLTPRRLVTQLQSGQVKLGGQNLSFRKGDGSHHYTDYTRNVYANDLNRPIVARIQISGCQNRDLWDYAATQLDLKGLPGFYGTIEDLLDLYGLRSESGAAGFWFYALPKVQLTAFRCEPRATEIEVAVRPGHNPALVSLALLARKNQDHLVPVTITNDMLARRKHADTNILTGRLSVDAGPDPEVIVIYDDKVQQIGRPAIRTSAFPQYLSADPQFEYIRSGVQAALGLIPRNDPADIESLGEAPATKSKAGRRKRPRLSAVARLYSMSGNRCAFPGCNQALFQGKHTLANVCHISAASEGGPRYDLGLMEEARHDFDNLILLCPTHHVLVDRDTTTYTVGALKKMKTSHEAQFAAVP